MLIYLDSSAIVKRSVEEAESDALDDALELSIERGDVLTSSTLGWVEASRAIRSRREAEDPARVRDMVELALSGIVESPIDEQVIALARRLGPHSMRTLDAIHLATAILLDVDVVVAYDERLLRTAEEYGLRTLSPAPGES